MRRWTRKSVAWVAAGMTVLLLGLWRLDFQVVAIGLVASMFLLVAYVRRTPVTDVRRRPSHLRVLEGDEYDMGFNVGVRGGWADAVELHDLAPGYMDLSDGSNHSVMPLYKGELRRTGYTLQCPLRGAYRVGPVDMRTSDAMGFFDQETTIHDVHELDVVSLYVELRSLDLQSRALKYNMGPVTINELGRSTDFYSIREYVKGDPYRKINWKASAKRRKLMINEDEKETLSDCAIFVDSRALSATGTPVDNFHEQSLRATLGLSRTLVSAKNRVMVVTYNDAVNIVPPGLGNAHNRVVQAMLVETVAKGTLTYDWAAGYARPFIKPRSDVVVFSPLLSDMTVYPTILNLIRTGHRVVVVTAQLEDYEERATGVKGSRSMLMALQRSTNIAELEGAGIPVIDVEPDEPQLSILVRIGAALGGERLDVSALEGEAAEELPEFEEEVHLPLLGRSVTRDFQDEVLGVRLGMPRLMLLQALALICLVGASLMTWFMSQNWWEFVNDGPWGVLMDTNTFVLLTFTGLILGWALAMLLGYLRYWRLKDPASNLVYLAYAALLLIVLWHVGSALWSVSRGAGPLVFVWDMVLIPPLLGALAIFRRTFVLALFSMGFILIVTLIEPNPMDDAWKSLLMALAVVSFVELTWAIERFDRLFTLGGQAMERGRGLQLFRETVERYLMVFAVVVAVAAMMTVVMTYLPAWYSPDPGKGVISPLEPESVFAPVYLLFWLVVAALVGRWAVITFLGSRRGGSTVRWLRERVVLPGTSRARARKRAVDEPVPEGDDWDEEAPLPDVPVPHA
ncbi:MAG: DUF58 domain-containing protein [Thermoplasmata archaeon]|nr:MAG: DUF58 domain-containing protein [Thermoplasmata archaeon]